MRRQRWPAADWLARGQRDEVRTGVRDFGGVIGADRIGMPLRRKMNRKAVTSASKYKCMLVSVCTPPALVIVRYPRSDSRFKSPLLEKAEACSESSSGRPLSIP